MPDSKPFAGQIALVTGASRGIGAATAIALAQAGAHVVLTARDTKLLEAVEQQIFEAGGAATIAPADLTDGDALARLAIAIGGRWPALDMLVHCAAVLPQLTAVKDIDQNALSRALTINVLASQALLARFHPMLKASDNARIVALTSTVASAPRAYWGAYAASKAASEVLFDCFAQEALNTSSIRVAIVNPGATRTAMRRSAYPGEDPASVKPPEAVAARLIALLGEQFASPHRETVNQP